jgi:hypothetical protein
MGYDELLFDRVNQLKAIDDRLERIIAKVGDIPPDMTRMSLSCLRDELATMIRVAEEEHAAF